MRPIEPTNDEAPSRRFATRGLTVLAAWVCAVVATVLVFVVLAVTMIPWDTIGRIFGVGAHD
jgi:hypothetical protein